MSTEVIIDCDPGHDDAIALLLALQSDELEVRGVTTVAGNHTLPKTTRNVLRTLTLADRKDVPVASGMAEPMVRELTIADHVHGESGLDGPGLPDPGSSPVDEDAVDFIARTASESDGLTLVPVGPLTNIGMLLKRYPETEASIDRIVLMGGGIYEGNITPAAEFNIFVDPEAADIVFSSEIPVTMVGLEVTRSARVAVDEFDRFRDLGSEVGTVVAGWLEFFLEFHRDQFGWDGVPIHDACAVAEVINPGIVESEAMHVAVETASDHADGQTICDRRGVLDEAPNAEVGVDIDRERFVELLVDALSDY
ncbi:nucleoside hydrolase [Natrinema gelatinilyticum]|uniref:nucleoside hydrolase n=1 Tax=Natrinema gelatinilyticum TaxID=2961571 RepID=UPI0020C4357E|nr:nucleoside hydrolase [Natrinema gelatinilyticum]